MTNLNDELKKISYDPATGQFFRKGREIGTRTTQGYLSSSIAGKTRLLHRMAILISTGELPKCQVDHINGVRTDNRLCNLRCVTAQQNRFNRCPNKDRDLQIKNVYWLPHLNKYRVKMKINKVTRHFGYFDSLSEAAKRAKEVQLEIHGEYAPVT